MTVNVNDNDNRPTRQGILPLSIKDKAVLYAAYMPFIRNGGLFVPTDAMYEIGNDVFMVLDLLDEEEKIPVTGTVVWITPIRSQSNHAAGIGIQFKDVEGNVRKKIEILLAGQLNSGKQTNTM